MRSPGFVGYHCVDHPIREPADVQDRMIDATRRFLPHIGYDNAPFNIEYYWNSQTNEIRILEANTRISKSHSPLFMMVDGEPHQKVAIELALGHRPAGGRDLLQEPDDLVHAAGHLGRQ